MGATKYFEPLSLTLSLPEDDRLPLPYIRSLSSPEKEEKEPFTFEHLSTSWRFAPAVNRPLWGMFMTVKVKF